LPTLYSGVEGAFSGSGAFRVPPQIPATLLEEHRRRAALTLLLQSALTVSSCRFATAAATATAAGGVTKMMIRLLKILGWGATAMLVLVGTAVVALNLVPATRYKGLIRSLVKSATGRELVIGGDLDVGLGSRFSIAASDIRFSNPE
jgi:hypothetical protein